MQNILNLEQINREKKDFSRAAIFKFGAIFAYLSFRNYCSVLKNGLTFVTDQTLQGTKNCRGLVFCFNQIPSHSEQVPLLVQALPSTFPAIRN